MRVDLTNLNKWETYIHQGGPEALAVAQAAVLGQTYGMLSGQPNDLLMTESFHGTIIAWARQAGIFRAKDPLSSVDLLDPGDLESTWKRWAQAEETVRVILALYIHDAEFAAVFHHEPLLRHDPSRLPVCSSDQLLAAPTAAQWYAFATSTTSTLSDDRRPGTTNYGETRGLLYSYALLAGHYAAISEARCGKDTVFVDSLGRFRESLVTWSSETLGSQYLQSPSSSDPFCLMILWHEAFMTLYADFNMLERVIGRDGAVIQTEDVDRVGRWVADPHGRYCAVHATLIYKRLEKQMISLEPAIHVPKALFHVGIVVYCHVKFRTPTITSGGDVDIPELRSRGLPSTMINELDSSILYGIADLLRRQGHWDISRRFASILDVLIDDLMDPTMGC